MDYVFNNICRYEALYSKCIYFVLSKWIIELMYTMYIYLSSVRFNFHFFLLHDLIQNRMRVTAFFKETILYTLVFISTIKYIRGNRMTGEIHQSIVNVFAWHMTLWINRSFKSIYLRIQWQTFIKKCRKQWKIDDKRIHQISTNGFGCVCAPRFVLAVISICFVDILANAST